MLSAGCEMCIPRRMNLPKKRNADRITSAITISRTMIAFRRRGSTFPRTPRKTGMFPSGSRTRNKVMAAV